MSDAPPLGVRRATPADAAPIAAVHLASWRAAYRDDAPEGWLDAQTVEGRTDAWTARLDASGRASHTLVATDRNTVVAFGALATPSRDADADEDTAEVEAFYVHPDRFRSGVGGTLMRAALDELTRLGYETVTLWVLATNARARGFYATHGFADDGGRLQQGGWPTEIRMRRAL